VDQTDREILEILRRDGRARYVSIAGAVGLTEGAVRRRVRRMLEAGVIRRFTVEAGAGVEGIVLVKTGPAQTGAVAVKIREVADRVFEVSGDYDVAALIHAHTMEELNRKVDRIRGLPEVLNTNTLVRLVGD